MRYGVISPNFGYCGDPNGVLELAQCAESSGWDGFFLWDHLQWPESEPSIDPWVDPATQARVVEAAVESGEGSRLRPLYEALGQDVSYEAIRITLAFEGVRYE